MKLYLNPIDNYMAAEVFLEMAHQLQKKVEDIGIGFLTLINFHIRIFTNRGCLIHFSKNIHKYSAGKVLTIGGSTVAGAAARNFQGCYENQDRHIDSSFLSHPEAYT
jgi:hypothetical protein